MAEVPQDAELNSEPLKYTTWVLRVSIHCEGCKRKVKRILHSVEGVYTIDVERKQHRVIVTGNVDANTLIRKLEKSGKHAELWPNRNNINYQNDEQQQQNEDEQNQTQSDQQQQQQNPENSCQQQQQNPDNSCQQQQQNGTREVRFASNVISPGNDVTGNSGPAAPKKKKKKKKSNSSGNSNVNNTVNNNEPEAQPQHEQQHCNNNNGPPHPESQQQYMGPSPGMGQGPGMGPGMGQGLGMGPGMGQGPGMGSGMGPGSGQGPCNRVYEYAPVYHAPQPMCGVSYNTEYPRTYTASYHTAPSPYSYSYAYSRGGDVEMSMPLDLGGPSSLQPTESFELFSDENPNACSIM